MSKKTSTTTIVNNVVPTKKSKGFIHNATDTFHELLLIFLAVILIGGGLYSLFEGQSFFNGVWWALSTAFTVGYGDIVPHTAAGRVVGIAIMSLTVFVIIPLITARMASKMIVNDDAFTNAEQEKLTVVADRMNKYLDDVEKKSKATKVK